MTSVCFPTLPFTTASTGYERTVAPTKGKNTTTFLNLTGVTPIATPNTKHQIQIPARGCTFFAPVLSKTPTYSL